MFLIDLNLDVALFHLFPTKKKKQNKNPFTLTFSKKQNKKHFQQYNQSYHRSILLLLTKVAAMLCYVVQGKT